MPMKPKTNLGQKSKKYIEVRLKFPELYQDPSAFWCQDEVHFMLMQSGGLFSLEDCSVFRNLKFEPL